MAQLDSTTSWRTMERKRKPVAFIGAIPRVAETTIAINAHAEATCFRCGALIELSLVKWSIDEEPSPDSEPIRVEFAFPTVCPSCDRVFYDAKFGEKDGSA